MQTNPASIKYKYIVLLLSLCALFIPVYLIESNVLNVTGGVLVYPLDDTYIHMSIAKHLAQNNVWGVNTNEFTSASSSILYTLLLAGLFKIFSVNTIIPFVVNVVAAIVLVIIIQKKLQKENIGFAAQLIIFLLVIFFTPLPTLVLSGMEHTLQSLFSFILIFEFSTWMSNKKNDAASTKKLPLSIYITGILVCAIRYEGLFLIAVICCILLWEKHYVSAFAFGFVAVLPLIIFGLYSITKGSYFLPNSVLLKSSPVQSSGSGIKDFVSNVLINKLTIALNGITSLATQRLLLILPLLYLTFKKFLPKNSTYKYAILIITICTLLQLAFASTGWFYRYEAYLIVCAVVAVSILIYKCWQPFKNTMSNAIYPAMLLIIFVLFFPFILRSAAAYSKASQACINIYEQQYQMGKFLKKYYNSDTIALNDIGAASFFKHGGVIDLWGLADIDVAKSKKNHVDTPAFLYDHANEKGVKLAIVYDSWFDSSLLHKWQKVATWQIKNNVICGDSIVSFYATQNAGASSLKNNLINYKKYLPGDVNVTYY